MLKDLIKILLRKVNKMKRLGLKSIKFDSKTDYHPKKIKTEVLDKNHKDYYKKYKYHNWWEVEMEGGSKNSDKEECRKHIQKELENLRKEGI